MTNEKSYFRSTGSDNGLLSGSLRRQRQTSGSQNTQGKQDTELTKVIYIGGTLGDARYRRFHL